MPEHFARACKYRDRAAELRQLAETMTDDEPRDKMNGLATEYEEMAAHEEAKSTVGPSGAPV